MMADAYCNISGIDMSPETDYGMGPVDFKFSSGYRKKVLLEMKLASNKLMAMVDQSGMNQTLKDNIIIVDARKRTSASRL